MYKARITELENKLAIQKLEAQSRRLSTEPQVLRASEEKWRHSFQVKGSDEIWNIDKKFDIFDGKDSKLRYFCLLSYISDQSTMSHLLTILSFAYITLQMKEHHENNLTGANHEVIQKNM